MKITVQCLTLVLCCILCACSKPSETVAEKITLTYSIFFPPTHGQCEAAMSWAHEIEKKTGGRVKIDLFPGGSLTPAKECYDGVTKGISDIGMSCFAYSGGRFPCMEAVDLPLGYPSGTVATHVANEFYRIMQPKELEDVKVLYLHAHGPGLLHTRKAVRSLDDIKGMKIRSTGLSAKIVEALGGIAVAMPQGETYEALQKGVVEGTFGPIETLQGWKQAEVIKHTTDCVDIGYTTAMFVVMNLSTWNALPRDVQRVFEDVSAQWISVHADTWDKLDVEGRRYSLSLNNEIIGLSPQESQRWVSAVRPIIDDCRQALNTQNLPGDKAVSELQRLIQKYSTKGAGEQIPDLQQAGDGS